MTSLREHLREFGDPFSVERLKGDELPPYTHVVSFDDVAASDFDQVVASSAGALEAIDGVTEVEHADREIFYVHAPGVTNAAMTKALKAHWREAAKSGPKTPPRIEGPALLVDEVLLPAGFTRKGAVWNRTLGDGYRQYIEIFQNNNVGDLSGSFGYYIDALDRPDQSRSRWVGWRSSHLHELMDHWIDRRDGLDVWTQRTGRGNWPYPDGAKDQAAWIADTLLPYLEQRRTIADLVDLWGTDGESRLWIETRLRLLLHLGRRDEAVRAFHEHALTAGHDDEIASSQRLGEELGLPAPPKPSGFRQRRNRRMKDRPWASRAYRS